MQENFRLFCSAIKRVNFGVVARGDGLLLIGKRRQKMNCHKRGCIAGVPAITYAFLMRGKAKQVFGFTIKVWRKGQQGSSITIKLCLQRNVSDYVAEIT